MKGVAFRLASLFALAALAADAQQAPATSKLPAGPGKQLVVDYCAKCHELKRIEEDQGTEAEWITRIRRMIRRGATIPSEQIAPLGKYLAQALPPRVRAHIGDSSPIATAVAEAKVRPIQTWLRTSGRLQNDTMTLLASLPASDTTLVKAGQRARAFALGTRSSMYQAKVVSVASTSAALQVTVQLAARTSVPSETYLIEIIAEGAPALSIPNEAIIEEGDHRRVYVQQGENFLPREIETGRQGELHTEVVSGLSSGEQVVTFGSFFIDAEYKLKASPPSTGSENLAIDYRGLPDPPRAGDNSVEVLVKQADGAPLADGIVTVTYSMAAMPSMNMPEMKDSFTLIHTEGGKYAGDVRLSMGGTWQVNVTVSRDGQPLDKKEFSVVAK